MAKLIAIFFPIVVLAQDAPPVFEVASVRQSSSQVVINDTSKPGASRLYLRYNPDGIEAGFYPLRALIMEAYQIQAYQGGVSRVLTLDPRTEGLMRTTFDVIAKAGRAASKEELRMMLRTLLAERFKLTMHPETKQQPVYRLVAGKQGSKLLPSAAEVENPHWVREPGGMTFQDASLGRLSALLSNYVDRPVLDSTGIAGLYNFPHLDGISSSEDGQSALFTALRELGLQLVGDKAPLEYFVVDHLEAPSAN